MAVQSMGIVGLGVMGRNLARNLADHGYGVVAYDAWETARTDFAASLAAEPAELITLTDELSAFAARLPAPRAILIMIKAGAPVDQLIDALTPLLEPGDLLIDGGNSHYHDTVRRESALKASGIAFIGLGVSGGEEGARNGPALMAGGTQAAYELAGPMLEAIAAQHDGAPCCALLGPGGAGHYVKMVHNGIEYALMQVLAEAYQMMRDVLGLDHDTMSRVFAGWNRGVLASYLVEIAGHIMTVRDGAEGRPLLETILDKAGQKGTGRWSSEAALAFGSPAMSIAEAVFARAMAGAKDERLAAANVLAGPDAAVLENNVAALEHLRQAVLGAFVTSFAQGLALIEAGAREQGWTIDLAAVCRVWRAGCVIRAGLLEEMAAAYGEAAPRNLVCAPHFAQLLAMSQEGWRETVVLAVRGGIAVPALSSALAWYDSYRSARLPANLIQAQRDYFGAHTYERVDKAGAFHTDWAALADTES